MRAVWAALVLVLALALPDTVVAQRLAAALSDRVISIDSTFTGEQLTLFGNIEPVRGEGQPPFVEGPFDLVIVVTGPAQARVARRKTNVLGIWINTEQYVFENFPSFFWILSSGPLQTIADEETLEEAGLLPRYTPVDASQKDTAQAEMFERELLRLMTQGGYFGVNERGILFRSPTLYSAQLDLPSDVPNGNFLARTLLFKDGEIVASNATGFAVRKTGFERFLGTAARQYPFFYGLASVVLGIFTGWLGGVAFRR